MATAQDPVIPFNEAVRLDSGQAKAGDQAIAVSAADIDGDGAPDLVVGVSGPGGSRVELWRGDVRCASSHGAVVAPFVFERALALPLVPDFVGFADVDLDGVVEVIAAQRGRAGICIVGPSPGWIETAGTVSAIAAGEFGLPDGATDIVVLVDTPSGALAQVFRSAEGGGFASGVSYPIGGSATAVRLGRTRHSGMHDIVIGCGEEVVVIQADGRLERRPAGGRVTDLVIGRFTTRELQVAVLVDGDALKIVGDDTPLARGVRGSKLISGRIAAVRGETLLTLDAEAPALHVTTADSGLLQERAPLSLGAVPLAVEACRLNRDAQDDLVLLTRGSSAPAYVLSSARATFTVTNTSPTGPGSYAQAIIDSNNLPGLDMINFAVGTGTPTITAPMGGFPSLNDAVIVDGATGGATRIELDGAGGFGPGVAVGFPGCTVDSLVVNDNQFDGVGLFSDDAVILNCFIGTNAAGNAAVPNGRDGIALDDSIGNTIGGSFAGSANVISGNGQHGIALNSSGCADNVIIGNLIGTNAAGNASLGNGANGVFDHFGVNSTIGGDGSLEGNVISGNGSDGIEGIGNTGLDIIGNAIGVNGAGTSDLGNSGNGILLFSVTETVIGGAAVTFGNDVGGNALSGLRLTSGNAILVAANSFGANRSGVDLGNDRLGIHCEGEAAGPLTGVGIGGVGAASANSIEFNKTGGVLVDNSSGFGVSSVTILGNRISRNNGLGINLANSIMDGVTANDAGDADTGANALQNYPVLSSVVVGTNTTVSGTLNSLANTTFTLEFFANDACDSSGFGEGQVFLGRGTTTTAADGNATFSITVAGIAAGVVTATATDPAGNTSEFSACIAVRQDVDLSLVGTASVASVNAGERVTYTFTIMNDGPDPAPSVVFTDNLPSSLVFVDCDATAGGMCGGSGNNRTVTFASLDVDEVAVVTIVAAVDCDVAAGAVVWNDAAVTSAGTEGNPADNATAVDIGVTRIPDLVVTYEGGGSSLEYSAIGARKFPGQKPPQARTFTISNESCFDVDVLLAELARTTTAGGRITDLDDRFFFEVFMVDPNNPGGPGVLVPIGGQVTIPDDESRTFRVEFDPVMPPVVGGTSNLKARDVLPNSFRSEARLLVNGVPLVIPIGGRVKTAFRLIDPSDPADPPLVTFSRSGSSVTVDFSAYDSNRNVQRATYEFLNGSGGLVRSFTIDVSGALNGSTVVRGQSFTVRQRFSNADSSISSVRVTVSDSEVTRQASSGGFGKNVVAPDPTVLVVALPVEISLAAPRR